MSEQQTPPLPPAPDQKPTTNATPQSAPAATAADWFRVVAKKVKELALSFAGRSKAAGQLVAKQTERTKLTKITLPNTYRVLGKHVHGAHSFHAEFPEIYDSIDSLLTEIAILPAEKAKVRGFGEKAKAIAKAAKDKTKVYALNIMVNRAYTELGKAAFEKHGDNSGSTEVLKPILDCRARLGTLAAEIAQVSQSQPGTILTPLRLAIGALTVAVLVLLLAVKMTLFGGRH